MSSGMSIVPIGNIDMKWLALFLLIFIVSQALDTVPEPSYVLKYTQG